MRLLSWTRVKLDNSKHIPFSFFLLIQFLWKSEAFEHLETVIKSRIISLFSWDHPINRILHSLTNAYPAVKFWCWKCIKCFPHFQTEFHIFSWEWIQVDKWWEEVLSLLYAVALDLVSLPSDIGQLLLCNKSSPNSVA